MNVLSIPSPPALAILQLERRGGKVFLHNFHPFCFHLFLPLVSLSRNLPMSKCTHGFQVQKSQVQVASLPEFDYVLIGKPEFLPLVSNNTIIIIIFNKIISPLCQLLFPVLSVLFSTLVTLWRQIQTIIWGWGGRYFRIVCGLVKYTRHHTLLIKPP